MRGAHNFTGKAVALTTEAYQAGFKDGQEAERKRQANYRVAYLIGGPKHGERMVVTHGRVAIARANYEDFYLDGNVPNVAQAPAFGTYLRDRRLVGPGFGPNDYEYIWQGWEK